MSGSCPSRLRMSADGRRCEDVDVRRLIQRAGGIRPSVERATGRTHGTVEIARARADMVRSEPQPRCDDAAGIANVYMILSQSYLFIDWLRASGKYATLQRAPVPEWLQGRHRGRSSDTLCCLDRATRGGEESVVDAV
jgi:hypothetical protein